MPEPALPDALWDELAGSQHLGLIGPKSLEVHVQHAVGFAEASGVLPRLAVDLGPGGGLPSLVLAALWPESHWVLVEVRERAVARLDVMIARLGWTDRVSVRPGSAEVAGHSPDMRESFDLATARGFGFPAMTAECAAPLLVDGGRLVVSEPPDDHDRWPAEAMDELGLTVVSAPDAPYMVASRTAPCPDRFPRRDGMPRRRPLW